MAVDVLRQTTFTDTEKHWERTAWMHFSKGFLSGRSRTSSEPKHKTTRAEVVERVYNLLNR